MFLRKAIYHFGILRKAQEPRGQAEPDRIEFARYRLLIGNQGSQEIWSLVRDEPLQLSKKIRDDVIHDSVPILILDRAFRPTLGSKRFAQPVQNLFVLGLLDCPEGRQILRIKFRA